MKKVKLIAVLAALATGVCLYFFLSRAAQPQETPKTNVVVAAADIAANTVVTADMLQYAAVPNEAVLTGAVTDMTSAVGKITDTEILAGEQVLTRKLVDAVKEQTGGSLSYAVADGMRAAAVAVDATSGVAGLIKPGNRVDVVVIYQAETAADAAGQSKTQTAAQLLLQNIAVLAVDKVTDKAGSADMYATITLEVTPEQALDLNVARNVGSLSLLLRSPIDSAEAGTGIVTDDILK